MGGLGALLRKVFNIGGGQGVRGAAAGLGGLGKPTVAAVDPEELERDRRERAMAFLGRSYVVDPFPEDDAPNIIIPGPLLDTSSSAVIPQQTTVPQIIPAPRGESDRSLSGVVAEIERINVNITEIQRALANTAISEQKYRNQLIKERERRIAQVGQARSRRRSERRRQELFESFRMPSLGRRGARRGGFLGQVKEAGILGLGLELGAFVIDAIKNFLGIRDEERPSGPRVPPMSGVTPEAQAAVAMIRKVEGTIGAAGPSTFFGGGQPYGDLTKKTVAEVGRLQDQFIAEGRGTFTDPLTGKVGQSAAVGIGQFITPKIEDIVRNMGEDPNTALFTEELQTRMIIYLANSIGVDLNKPLTEADIKKLNAKWAGLGPQYGQTTRTIGESLKIYNDFLKKIRATRPPAPVLPPAIMPKADEPGSPGIPGDPTSIRVGQPVGFVPKPMRPTPVPDLGPVAKAPIFLDMRQKVTPFLKGTGSGITNPNTVPSLDPKPYASLYEPILGVGVG